MYEFAVYQRSGRRWVCVGQFGLLRFDNGDRVTIKEALREFLWKNGIQNPNMHKYCAKQIGK